MSLKDLSVHIGADTSEFSKGVDTVNEGIQSTQETAETASKSLASQASSLASEYKKQGLNASEAFKKAWSEIERTSTQSSTSKSKSFFSGFNLFSQSAKSGFDSLNNSMSKTFDTMNALSSGIKSLAKSAFALVGIATGIAGVVKAFTAYTALESSVNRVNDIFAESSKYIQYFAQNTAKSLGMAESSVYEYASTFGNLFSNITSDSYENAKVTISMLQASAVIASKTGRTMEDVMERIRSGLLGNTEAIEDLGINVNVAMLEVTDAFSQIADGRSWEQLSFYEQQQIRTLAILEQASGSFGDEIQQGSAYSVSVLTGAVEDFMSTAGEFVNEVFQPIIKYLTTTVQTVTTVFQSLNTDALQPIVNTLHTVVQYAVTALKSLVNIIGIDVSFNENSSELPNSFSASANNSGEISDNMSDTEKSAKKLQKILTGFDELNILSSPDNSSSDSDATSGTGSGQSVFSSLPDLAFSDEPALSVDIDTTKLEKNLAKVQNKLKPLTDNFSNLWDSLKPFANTIGEGLKWFWDNVLVPLGSWTIEKAVPTFLDLISEGINLFTGMLKDFKPLGEWLWEDFFKPVGEWTGKTAIKGLKSLTKLIKKLGDYTPALNGLVTGLAAFAGLNLLSKIGVIAKISAGFATLKATILPVITAFQVAGGGISGFFTVIKTGIGTAIASFSAFMKNLSPFLKIGVTIAGVVTSFNTAFSAIYKLETGSISLGEALKNLGVVIVPVGIALTTMLGPVGLAVTAVSTLAGAIFGATEAVENNIEAVSKSVIYDEMGTPVTEYANAVTSLANTIDSETAGIISLGDTIKSNDEKIKSNSDEFQGLIDRLTVTGDMTEEMAEKIKTSASEISTAAQTNITESTNGIIQELGKHFEETALISGKSTQEIVSNLYLLEAEGNQLIANTYKEIDELSASMVNMDKSSEEFTNAQSRLSELSNQLLGYTGYADTTVESADSLIKKLQELDSNKIDWESEEAVTQAVNTITEGYANSLADIDSASASAVKVIENQYNAYKNMGILDEEGEKMFANLKEGIISGYESQRAELTKTIDEKINDLTTQAKISYDNAFSAAEQEIYNGSFGGFFTHLGTALASKWNGKDFEEETTKNIANSIDTSVFDAVEEAKAKIKSDALMYGAGEYISEGFAEGIENKIPVVAESTKRMTTETKTTTTNELDEHSPSRVFYKYGENVGLGFRNGILSTIPIITSVLKNLCLSITSTAKNGLKEFSNSFKYSLAGISSYFKNFSSDINTLNNPFENYFSSVLSKTDVFRNDFTNMMWSVRDSLGAVFYNINVDCWNFGEELNYNLRNALNNMIANFNTTFQSLGALNSALAVIPGYSLSFDIPEIPYLAKGGVVNSPTLAMIGEAGKEAVVPLENSNWIDELAKRISTSGNSEDKEINITLNVSAFPNERAFQRYVVRAYHNEISRGGKIT